MIRLEHDITYPFHHVPQPKKQAAIVAAWKEKSYGPSMIIDEDEDGMPRERDEKFDILVETLGEVIVEYMQRKGK